MSWSDLPARSRRSALALLLSAAGLALAGCQASPLYATSAQTASILSSVEVKPVSTRVAQQVRNELVFLLSGGAGQPINPTYSVDLSVQASYSGVLREDTDEIPTAARETLTANYQIVRIDTGEVIDRGRRSIVSSFDQPLQEFARIRAERDAENRAARELAQLLRADIVMALRP